MQWKRSISLMLAVICISPAFIIPAHWGFSITDVSLEMGNESEPQSEMAWLIYILLNGYYILFLLASLLPFVFFTFSSSLIVGKQRRSTRSKHNKDIIKKVVEGSPFESEKYPKVSIIVPCYNEALHVSSTITNCFRQDYKGKIEIIVVDDGSLDDTWSIGRIMKMAENDREIRVFHKPNGGKASALKYGIERSKGTITLMTDGDSSIHPNAVTSIVETFRTYPDAGIVGGYVFIKNANSCYLTRLQQLEYIITQHLIRINQSEDGSVLIAPGPIFGMRTDLAKALPPLNRTIVEDCDLTMSILPTGYTTRATTNAISYTNAPETWSEWKKQRKRWIFGQFQAWRENRWHLKRNPWGVYTYFTWVWTTFSAILFLFTSVLLISYLAAGYENNQFIQFISIRTIIVFVIYSLSRLVVLIQYKEGRILIHYLPLKMIYDLVNGFLTAYLYMMYITKRGVRMSWGNRTEVIH